MPGSVMKITAARNQTTHNAHIGVLSMVFQFEGSEEPGCATYCKQRAPTFAILPLVELHADLFSRHAGSLEVDFFVAVDERGEYVVSD